MIPFPNQWPSWARGLAIIVIAVLIAFALLLFLPDASGEQREPPFGGPFESTLIKLDREALNEAYKKHMGKLFEIWVTDYRRGSPQPPRALAGANNAREAYTRSMLELEKREQELRKQ